MDRTLLFPNLTSDAVTLSQVHCKKDLGVLVDGLLSRSSRIDASVTKARGASFPLRGLLLRFSPLVLRNDIPRLAYIVQAWAPVLICDITKLEKIQKWPGMRYLSYASGRIVSSLFHFSEEGYGEIS